MTAYICISADFATAVYGCSTKSFIGTTCEAVDEAHLAWLTIPAIAWLLVLDFNNKHHHVSSLHFTLQTMSRVAT